MNILGTASRQADILSVILILPNLKLIVYLYLTDLDRTQFELCDKH